MKWLGRIDPLVLFLAAGLALYLALGALGLARGDERLIAVDEARLAAFLEGEGGRLSGKGLEELSAADRKKLVEDYAREEALYREARALGFDREDPAIRRRLVQSLRFGLQDEAQEISAPSDAELRAFLAAHRDRYALGARLSFSHIFFDKAKRGPAAAREAALRALPLAASGDWLAMGDRYPYQRSQVEVSEDALASEMGQDAARRIFAMPQGDSWQGPLESTLGFHLLRIDRKRAGKEPEFEKLRGQLAQGLAEEKRDRQLQRAIDTIVAGYRVELSPGIERQLQ